jgi:hypothetical protein
MKSIKKFIHYFLFAGILLLIFFLFQISLLLPKPVDNLKSIPDMLLTCPILILIGIILYMYIYYGRKYYVKKIEKATFWAWIKYAILWGVSYTGIGMPVVTLLVLFFGFSIFLPIEIAFTNTLDFLFSNPSLFSVCIIIGFTGGNIIFFKEMIKNKYFKTV